MGKIVYSIGLIGIVLLSCNRDVTGENGISSGNSVPFLFRMNAMFTDAEQNVSFPIWFNDSIVSKYKISKITRRFYIIEKGENEEDGSQEAWMPREKKEYFFGKSGQLERLNVLYYFDDQKIGNVSFVYQGNKDKYGFAPVTRISDQLVDQEDDDELSFYHAIHKKIKVTDKFLAFQQIQTGDYLFYMLNSKFWGPLSVDSILSPTPKDVIVLGSPYFPSKIYRVQNKVNEMDVQSFVYWKNSKTKQKTRNKNIQTLIRQEYPFEFKRTILTDKQGKCGEYIDSTFSEGKFLTRTLSEIHSNTKNLPVKIIHKKQVKSVSSNRLSIEILTYEFQH